MVVFLSWTNTKISAEKVSKIIIFDCPKQLPGQVCVIPQKLRQTSHCRRSPRCFLLLSSGQQTFVLGQSATVAPLEKESKRQPEAWMQLFTWKKNSFSRSVEHVQKAAKLNGAWQFMRIKLARINRLLTLSNGHCFEWRRKWYKVEKNYFLCPFIDKKRLMSIFFCYWMRFLWPWDCWERSASKPRKCKLTRLK